MSNKNGVDGNIKSEMQKSGVDSGDCYVKSAEALQWLCKSTSEAPIGWSNS